MDFNAMMTELERDEGLRLKPYRDSARSPEHPDGILTIGVGRNLEDVGISEEEAHYLLRNDIERAVAAIDHVLPWAAKLDEVRFRVLVNMVFNMGITRLRGFRKMLAACAAGHYWEAAAEMLDSEWARQVGSRADRLYKMMLEGGT